MAKPEGLDMDSLHTAGWSTGVILYFFFRFLPFFGWVGMKTVETLETQKKQNCIFAPIGVLFLPRLFAVAARREAGFKCNYFRPILCAGQSVVCLLHQLFSLMRWFAFSSLYSALGSQSRSPYRETKGTVLHGSAL